MRVAPATELTVEDLDNAAEDVQQRHSSEDEPRVGEDGRPELAGEGDSELTPPPAESGEALSMEEKMKVSQ